MEFTAKRTCITPGTRGDLSMALGDLERVLHRAIDDVRAKSESFKTVLPEPTVMTSRETAEPFLERVMAAHTAIKAHEEASGAFVESDTDTMDGRQQQPLKSVDKPLSYTRSEIEHLLAYLIVMTRTNVEGIIKNHLVIRTKSLQPQIFKAVKSILEDTLQESYFNSNNSLNLLCSTSWNKPRAKCSDPVFPYSVQGQNMQPRPGQIFSRHNCPVTTFQHWTQHFDRRNSWKDWWTEQLTNTTYTR